MHVAAQNTQVTSLTARVLPPEEWASKLAGTSLAQAIFDPDNAFVLVVEREGEVVACWAAINTVHVEGIWIHPDHRTHVAVGRLLLRSMFDELRALLVSEVITNADDPAIEAMLRTIGATPLPGTSWVMKVEGS
jgi:ribosomal protein S18 acetylase RimI-like enzyme